MSDSSMGFRARLAQRASNIYSAGSSIAAVKLESLAIKLDAKLEERRETRSWGGTIGTSRESGTSSPGLSRFSGYFGKQVEYNTEERINSFDGHATIRIPRTLQQDPRRIEVLVSGYCTKLRPIEHATRTQRVFYNLARSFSALPRISHHFAGVEVEEPLELSEEEMKKLNEMSLNDLMENKQDILVDVEDVPITAPTLNPLSRRPGLPRGLSSVNTPTNRSTTATTSSVSTPTPMSPSGSRPNSRPNSAHYGKAATGIPPPLVTGRPFIHNSQPQPFKIHHESELPRLHYNLTSRLRPFFAGKLIGRSVRVSVYIHEGSGTLYDTPLFSKILITDDQGKFESNLLIPYPMSSPEITQLKIITELLSLPPTEQLVGENAEVSCSDEVILYVGVDAGVRVISDIDDTIKHSVVLGSLKEIFSNVFCRELDEIIVPGVVDWYHQMKDASASIHYVSNGPIELFPTISEFLEGGGFPKGSIRLKAYGGGSSMLAKLWEDAGNRKRQGLVDLLQTFKKSKFILIGDSGEQDLNVFTSLAAEFGPKRILAIFIRDVTTPPTPLPPSTTPSVNFSSDVDSPTSGESSRINSPNSSRPNSIHFDLEELSGSYGPEDLMAIKPIRPKLGSRKKSSFTRTNVKKPTLPDIIDDIIDPSTDPLSPNNPTQTQIPLNSTEEGIAKIQQFYVRIAEAEKVLGPLGIRLRIFRDGREVMEEGVKLVEENR